MNKSLIAPDKARAVLAACNKQGLKLATAESCTGGLIAAALTDIAGSASVVECGFVTYSNAAKNTLIGVPAEFIEQYGAVSRQVAMAMAEGALQHSRADIAVAVTGIAGPDGGTDEKPVGLVHMAVAAKGRDTRHYEARFGAKSRPEIRHATVEQALDLVLDMITGD